MSQDVTYGNRRKDHGGNKLTEPSSPEVPERRWGSLATDLIVGFSKTENVFDCITTSVDRLPRRVHFIPSKESDTAVYDPNSLLRNLF